MDSNEGDADDDIRGRVVGRQNVCFNARAEVQVAAAADERVRHNTDGDCNGERLGKLLQLRLLGARKHRHQTDVTLNTHTTPPLCSVCHSIMTS